MTPGSSQLFTELLTPSPEESPRSAMASEELFFFGDFAVAEMRYTALLPPTGSSLSLG